MTGGLWLSVYAHVATLLLPVVCCAGVGAAWGLRGLFYPAEFIATLATLVSTPALVFHTLSTTRLDNMQLLEVGSATLLGLALAAVLSGITLRSLNMPARTLGSAATFPNTGNLGLPIAQLVFGDTGLAVAVAFFTVNSIVQHTLGVWVMSSGSQRSQPLPKGVMFACLLAVVLRVAGVTVPAPVLESTRLVGSLAVPLMLLSLGYALVTVSREGIRQGAVLGALRLLIGLLVGAMVVYLIPLPPLVAGVMTLQFAMPVAIVNCVYVQRFSTYGDVAAGAVLVSTAAFLLLCPLLIWLATAGRF
jgi:predicted permease